MPLPCYPVVSKCSWCRWAPASGGSALLLQQQGQGRLVGGRLTPALRNNNLKKILNRKEEGSLESGGMYGKP